MQVWYLQLKFWWELKMRSWFRRKKNVPKQDNDIDAVVNKFEEELTSPKEKQLPLLSRLRYRLKSNARFAKETNAKYANGKENSK